MMHVKQRRPIAWKGFVVEIIQEHACVYIFMQCILLF